MRHFLFKLLLLIAVSLSLSITVIASEKIPDDIRYMLEDMYGADKKEWPSPRYKTDLNNDGFDDWVAVKKDCKLKKACQAEIFICRPDNQGRCSEYCYLEVKILKNVAEDIKNRKCESTC